MGSCGRRRSGVALCLAALAASLAPTGTAFYLPGVAPYNYEAGERVEIRVNKLTSTHTQLPENYYSLPFCVPDEGVHHYGENLGLFLTGDRIENSPYRVYMQHDESCKILCQKSLTKDEALLLTKAVWNEYRHNWIVDNLPAASRTEVADYVATSHSQGFPVGFMSDGKYYLNNHLHLIIDYHPVNSQENPDARVVGFIVVPFSVQHVFKAGQTWDGVSATIPPLKTCETMLLQNPIPEDTPWQEVVAGEPILFTFDVEWHWSETEWASRWDIYLSMDNKDTKVHWFSIVDSLLIVVFLTAMIGMILLRNLHRDIMRYNRVPTEEERAEEREESGWKLVHADVFRPPARAPMLLAVSVGTGMQIVCMGFATIFFAAVGFLSPANRGSLMIAVLLLYVMFGSVAGYHSARLYKTFKGKQFQRCTILTALLYPSICFSTFFILNIVTWSYGSTQAVPFLSIITLLLLWFGISVPLVFLGAYFGFKKDPIEYPVVTSNIPRQIPDAPWFLTPYFTIAVGGVLPFAAVFVEMYFIFNSIWMGQYYYVFGFLLLVFMILLITCADIAMVFCYFQLCAEDYNWWWRSFLTSGSTAGYVFLLSVHYFSRLQSTMFATYMLYFGYMAIISLGMFLMCGCIGLFSCLWFCRKMFGSIKVD